MIGAIYQQKINNLLSEFGSSWIELKASFDYLYEAACDFAKETGTRHNSQTITTVSGTAGYSLNPDFIEIMVKDDHGLPMIAYNDGSSTTWLGLETYSDYLQNDSTSGTPSSFAVTDLDSMPSKLTGKVTTAGAQAGGESVLTDTSGSFLTLFPGDTVVNTTNDYYGVVLQAPATATAVTTAMFNPDTRGSAYAGWAKDDTYIVQPAGRYKIFLDPAPSTSGHTVTVTYFAKPYPVYSDYGSYPFATGYEDALIKYAAWLYKTRDSKPAYGDPLYVAYDRQLRKAKNVNRKAVGATGFRVNFMK